ncbi:MAG: tyrosine-type recombinase/integrase [Candidatus Saccharimonadales bacterium]
MSRYNGYTLASYRLHLELWFRWCSIHHLPPLQAKRAHLELWLRSLEQAGLSSSTRAQKFGIIHLFYKYARIDRIIPESPTEHITRPRVLSGSRKLTWLPILDSVALLSVAMKTGEREHVIVVILSQMALRVGELCSLNVSSIQRNQGWHVLRFKGKGGNIYERVIPIQVISDLEKLIDGKDPDEPLVLNTRGDRMNRASVARLVNKLAARAGIFRPITPHGLRRSAATNMLAQGIPLRDVQLQLRHVDPKMTMRYDQGKNSIDRSAVLPYASSQYGMLYTN